MLIIYLYIYPGRILQMETLQSSLSINVYLRRRAKSPMDDDPALKMSVGHRALKLFNERLERNE